MKRRLWQLFGPLVCAGVLVLGVLLAPLPLGRLSDSAVASAALSMSPNVLAGARAKNQALSRDYVPFFGSSELSRLDPFHPAVLAAKYHRSYRPFLVGAAGTQSLTHFLTDQSMLKQLRHKKAVFIVSMQWFTRRGQDPRAFDFFYSPLETVTWLLAAKNTVADRYAARRLLTMRAPSKDAQLHGALLTVAAGQPLGDTARQLLRTRLQMLKNEDELFSRFGVNAHEREVAAGEKLLPNQATNSQLDALAEQAGVTHTRSNQLGIDDTFYRTRLANGRMAKLAGSQKHFDYRFGPEYSDFQLLLSQFAKHDIDVQFIIPPINAKWAAYTGLSQAKYAQAVEKLKTQLKGQGFKRVLDLSQDGGQPYFMQDTIHIGWRGWVKVDKVVAPFLDGKRQPVHYMLNDHFFTKSWRQAVVGG
ncbi:D-alanyl-lipoteichoic acid biosynthesis protein DltD [Lacticaseibacillus daqingensis]|uniref:D-alanyl-lipoteichoic acid biosynthesis protein DltD n=1 Tax=Lacticaseibacillus daqingensis TaxID=2486014 RepID=UPI000F78B2CC|nr:D-alanyl-lipoteichoic acid biosynthesis protein DltD [Lacticaseibacillus daqingensis]